VLERLVGAEGARDGIAVHAGKPDIADHDVRVESSREVERRRAIVRDAHVVPVELGFIALSGSRKIVALSSTTSTRRAGPRVSSSAGVADGSGARRRR